MLQGPSAHIPVLVPVQQIAVGAEQERAAAASWIEDPDLRRLEGSESSQQHSERVTNDMSDNRRRSVIHAGCLLDFRPGLLQELLVGPAETFRRQDLVCDTHRRPSWRHGAKKASGTFVRSTLRALWAKVPVPFSNHALLDHPQV